MMLYVVIFYCLPLSSFLLPPPSLSCLLPAQGHLLSLYAEAFGDMRYYTGVQW